MSEWPAYTTGEKGTGFVEPFCVDDAIKGRTAVINKQANILFIQTSICGYGAESQDARSQHSYYHRLIHASLARSAFTSEGFQVLGNQLATVARHAYFAKQMDAVEQASQLMLAVPVSDLLRSVARYYQALCKWRRREIETPRQLRAMLEDAPPQFRARALQAVGLAYHEFGEVDTALHHYVEAGKASVECDLVTLAYSQSMTAIVRGIHGDHKQALDHLEELFPLVRAVGKYYPVLYYDFLNSLAVELAEVGRIAEADQACAVALASPFAAVHPNWAETRAEIAAKRVSATHSIVAVNRAPEIAPSPLAKPRREPKPVGAPAFTWPRFKKTSVQRAPRIAACATIPHDETTQTIIERVLTCVGSRAPPLAC